MYLCLLAQRAAGTFTLSIGGTTVLGLAGVTPLPRQIGQSSGGRGRKAAANGALSVAGYDTSRLGAQLEEQGREEQGQSQGEPGFHTRGRHSLLARE
jgi:hypothetical protein